MFLPDGMLSAEPVSEISAVRAITVDPAELLTADLSASCVLTCIGSAPEAKKEKLLNVETTKEESNTNINNMETNENIPLL
jgi:hypothetical protein